MKHDRRATLLTVGLITVVAAGLGTSPLTAAADDSAACPQTSTLTVATIAQGVNAVECDLVGAYVSISGMGFYLPEPGEGVGASQLDTAGDSRLAVISVESDGDVTARVEVNDGTALADEIAAIPASLQGAGSPLQVVRLGQRVQATAPTALDRCVSEEYSLTGGRWYTETVHWSFNDESPPRPSNISLEEFYSTAADALSWAAGGSECFVNPFPRTPLYVLDGGTAARADLTTSGLENICDPAGDGINVADFGNIVGTYVGFACWRLSGVQTTEADVRADNSSRSWVLDVTGCSGERWDLQSVLTHEWGHFWGLGHATSPDAAELTMSTSISPCDDSKRELGRGDVFGLVAIYGQW